METPHDIIIVGSGLTGLSVAQFLKIMQPKRNVLILEKSDRPGGAVQSFRENGFQAEWGPHGFLNNCPESQELLQNSGLLTEAQKAPLGRFARFLCHKGGLKELPQHPAKFLASSLLSPAAKIRLLGDLFIKPITNDQTIAQWADRRFGKAILPLVDAAITGTFAGDYKRLSIDSVMPGVRNLEKEYGSLLRGLYHKKKAGQEKKTGLPAMQNFPKGMEQLTSTLAKDKAIRLQQTVRRINREEDLWHLETATEVFKTNWLVLALPVNAALELLSPLSKPPVSEIPVARIANVVLGFEENAIIPKAFGYLAPEREKRFCLGVMFSSAMFPDRTPGHSVLIEALVGGRRHPERLELEDDEIIRQAIKDVCPLLGLPDSPRYSKVLRPAQGIPQLEMDHPALQNWRVDLEKRFSTLCVTGFGWDGIGMNEMIKAAKKTAQTLAEQGREDETEKEVRPVYF